MGRDWCAHDSQYILAWTIGDLAGHPMLERQVDWLAGLLAARGYPLERLARSLEIASGVLGDHVPDQRERIADLLGGAAESVRRTAVAG